MATRRKRAPAEEPDEAAATEPSRSKPITWPEIRDQIGTGGIIQFDCNMVGVMGTKRALRYSKRLPAKLLTECVDEDEIGDIMQSRGYPEGEYILQPRVSPGANGHWKPYGQIVSIPVEVGEGAQLTEFEEEVEEGEEPALSSGEQTYLERLKRLELQKREALAQAELEEIEERSQRRRDGGATQLMRNLASSPDGGVVRALAPVVTVIAEKLLEREPASQTATKAVIEMVSHQAQQMSQMQVAAMKEIMAMNMQMVRDVQEMALSPPQDPLSQFLPAALAALPLAFGKTGAAPMAPGMTPAAGPPQPGGSSAGGAPGAMPGHRPGASRFTPAQGFVRTVVFCLEDLPDVDVLYDERLRVAFGVLGQAERTALLQLSAEYDPLSALGTFIHQLDPESFEAFKTRCESSPDAAAWIESLVARIQRDFGTEEPAGIVEGPDDGEKRED